MIRTCFIGLVLLCSSTISAQNVSLKSASPKLASHLTRKPLSPDDEKAVYHFLEKNIQYPQMERDNNIQGSVMVRFLIDTAGNVTLPKVIRPVSPGLDKEALRVIKLLPSFAPAMYYKKPVPYYYTLRVVFKLM